MSALRHGLSIGLERTGDEIFLKLKATGTLTHKDYEILTPMLDEAVKAVPGTSIKAIVDLTELQGWELRAAWDDFKLGLKHGSEFSKIAIVGDEPWEAYAAKVAGWFIGGESKYFEDYDDAMDWLS